MTAALLLAALVAQTAPPAGPAEQDRGSEEQRREADLFGGAEPSAPVPRDDVDVQLAAANDPLTLGGLFYLRLQGVFVEDTDADAQPLSMPNLVDLYADARPTDRLRAYARARLDHDPTIRDTRVRLDQLWLSFDVERTVFLKLGQQRIKWGAGQRWNPTDFLNDERYNPIAVFDERLGVPLLKLHLPVESLGWNFYAIGKLDDAAQVGRVGGALRAELVFGLAEVTLTGYARRNEPLRLGADLSAGLGPFDVRAEVGGADEDDGWVGQAVGGADVSVAWSDQDDVIVGVEYFYNQAGAADPSGYLGLLQSGKGVPLHLGQQYLAATALLPRPGSWNDTTVIAAAIGNLSDDTWAAFLRWQVRVLTHLRFDVQGTALFGKEGGEFRYGPPLPPVRAVLGAGLAMDL